MTLKKLFLASLLPLTGCASIHHGNYAVISLSEIEGEKYELIAKNIVGEDESIYWALYAGPEPTMQEAVEDALEKSGGDFMKNVTATRKFWFIPAIWGEFKMQVKGEVWGKKEPLSQ